MPEKPQIQSQKIMIFSRFFGFGFQFSVLSFYSPFEGGKGDVAVFGKKTKIVVRFFHTFAKLNTKTLKR